MRFLASLLMAGARVSLVSSAVAAAKRKMMRALLVYSIVGVFALAGLVYLLAAAHGLIAARVGDTYAALYMGSGLLLLAVLIAVIYGLSTRRRRRPARSEFRLPPGAIPKLDPEALRKARDSVRGAPLQSVAIAAAVGYAAITLIRVLRGR